VNSPERLTPNGDHIVYYPGGWYVCIEDGSPLAFAKVYCRDCGRVVTQIRRSGRDGTWACYPCSCASTFRPTGMAYLVARSDPEWDIAVLTLMDFLDGRPDVE
jgi:hypothetical protein